VVPREPPTAPAAPDNVEAAKKEIAEKAAKAKKKEK
jgi:hypothetical protein